MVEGGFEVGRMVEGYQYHVEAYLRYRIEELSLLYSMGP